MNCSGKNCGAEIMWVETLEGKRQPFDREPNPEGNRVIVARALESRGHVAIPLTMFDEAGRERLVEEGAVFMPHHATCPDVERFR